MCKIKLLPLSLFLFISGTISGQGDISRFLNEVHQYKETHSSYRDPDITAYENIEGTPFLFTDYKDSEILTKDSNLYEVKLRYNLYADEMEYKTNGITFRIPFKNNIDKIILDGRTFIYLESPQEEGYYELLANGFCKLLGKYNVTFIPAKKAEPFVDAKPNCFKRNRDLFYLKKEEGPPEKITNKKTIFNYFGDKKTEIATFMKKNRISPNKACDLKKLTDFYNNL